MSMQRREVLKILTAAPFLGSVELARASTSPAPQARAQANETPWRVFEEPLLGEIAFPLGGI